MTIIFDSGALIAAERNDSRLATLIHAAIATRTPILIPTVVLAETWRGANTHPRIARALKVASGEPALTSALAREVGALMAVAGGIGIVDATVTALAAAHVPATVVTSDPRDIEQFAAATGRTHSFDDESRATDITIFPI